MGNPLSDSDSSNATALVGFTQAPLSQFFTVPEIALADRPGSGLQISFSVVPGKSTIYFFSDLDD